MQSELNTSKLNNLNERLQQKEAELKSSEEKYEKMESRNENNLNDLIHLNKNLSDECESLKRDIEKVRSDKLELETTVDDLKRTLKLTEKESQHIRAKLLMPSSSLLSGSTTSLQGGGVSEAASSMTRRAIMPPPSPTISLKSPTMSLESLISDSGETLLNEDEDEESRARIANDFAIDITHIEKMVQDTDAQAVMHKRPLDGVQSCLKSLRDQMCNLQQQQADPNVLAQSTQWKYRLGFTCEKCEMRWEIEHHVNDGKSATNGVNSDEFLDSPIAQQMPKCNCGAKLIREAHDKEDDSDLVNDNSISSNSKTEVD